MNKCEICTKESTDLFYVYNHICPELSYKTCRTCYNEERLPYYGIVGLLALPKEWEITIEEQTKKSLFKQAEKYYHKTHSEVDNDIKKAIEIIKEINGEKKK